MSPVFIFCVWCVIVQATTTANIFADGKSFREEDDFVVTRENMRALVSTENGEILAARVGNDIDGGSYLLHFFTMDPNSLFLPVLLHSDMVFYVHTGSGKLSWTEENELKTTDLRRGDVYRLKEGAIFSIQSNLETTERRKLRINAIFANTDEHEPSTGPYSSVRDMVLGFDKKVLQAAFKVPEEEIDELLNGAKPPAIIHGVLKSQRRALEMEAKFLGNLLGSRTYNMFELNKKKEKGSVKLYNIFKEDKDFENCNGWSTTVTKKKLSALKDADIGLFMVNLTTGSMMGPHWNPVATEIAVVLQGRGMVRVVCSSISNDTGCRNMRFEVEEGDVFAVPRFHPMAQMAFNNETFVFMGFSTSAKKNHPQYLAGQASVFRTLSKEVLEISFNVRNTTMDQLLASQQDSVILGCISCAEEELRVLEEEREKKREEAREREEEEAKKREEERRRKEEEAREREEEEAKRQEEERKRREEEEEEEAKRQEEERKRQEEEEEAKRQEEERKRREEEEEEEAKRQEEERKRREEEEEEEEEEAKRQEEERKRREEEEEEEEEAKRQEEERRRREEEEEEEAKRQEEETKRREEEEERRREEEAARREEEERERQEEEMERREAEEERRKQEEEIARREEEEREQREEEEEEEERQWQKGEEQRQRREEEEEEEEEERQWQKEEEQRQRKKEEARQRARERKEEEREEQHGRRRSEEEEAEEEERRREQEEREEEERERWHEEE